MGGVCAHGVGGGLRLCGDGMPDLGLLACDTETEGAVDGLLAAVAEPVHLGVSYRAVHEADVAHVVGHDIGLQLQPLERHGHRIGMDDVVAATVPDVVYQPSELGGVCRGADAGHGRLAAEAYALAYQLVDAAQHGQREAAGIVVEGQQAVAHARRGDQHAVFYCGERCQRMGIDKVVGHRSRHRGQRLLVECRGVGLFAVEVSHVHHRSPCLQQIAAPRQIVHPRARHLCPCLVPAEPLAVDAESHTRAVCVGGLVRRLVQHDAVDARGKLHVGHGLEGGGGKIVRQTVFALGAVGGERFGRHQPPAIYMRH